jgi:hypothetical protein
MKAQGMIGGLIFGLAGAILIIFVFVASKVSFELKKISFSELCANKEKYFGGKKFSFENGVVIYFNEVKGRKFAIFVPIPIPDGLNENTYILATLPTRLKVGYKVNITGRIEKVEHKGKTIYYIEGYQVTKTGIIDVTASDFQNLTKTIEEKEIEEREKDFFIWLIWFFLLDPQSPLISPFRPLINP